MKQRNMEKKHEDTLIDTDPMRLARILKYLFLSVLLWGAGTNTASAQEPEKKTSEETKSEKSFEDKITVPNVPESTFDYLLQKPPVTKHFKNKKFGDHLFVEVEGGFNILCNGYKQKPGYLSGISLGDWVTPEHGWRIGVGGRKMKFDKQYSKGLDISLDYLMNITAIANRKYGEGKPKPFEFYGIAGADVIHSNHYGIKRIRGNKTDWGYGMHLGLRAQWNAQQYLYLYAEPRAGLISNAASPIDTWHNFRTTASLAVGLGLRFNQQKEDKDLLALADTCPKKKQIFVSLMGGYTCLGNSSPSTWTERGGARAGISLGTWFNYYHGVRLTAQGSMFKHGKDLTGHVKALGVQADYMFNLYNYFAGYTNCNRFGLYLLVGGGYHKSWTQAGDRSQYAWSAGGGLQANMHLNDNYSVFVEGRADVFDKKYSPLVSSNPTVDIMPSLMAGVTYGFSPMYYRHKQDAPATFRRNKWHDHLFVEFGLGGNLPMSRVATDKGVHNRFRPQGYIAAGKWFTPVHGARIWTQLGQTQWGYNSEQRTKHLTLGLDYLYNFTNAWMGYLPERRFFVTGAVGVNVSTHQLDHKKAIGGNISLRGSYRLNNMTSLFIEPKAQIYDRDYLPHTAWTLNVSGMMSATAGVQLDLNANSKKTYVDYDKDELPTYVSAAMGADVRADDMRPKTALITSGRLSYTQFFTPWSAWRINCETGFGEIKKEKYNRTRAGGDIMADMTAHAYGYNPNRLCSVLAYIGANIGVENTRNKSFVMGDIHVGGQVAFKVGKKSSIFLETQIDYMLSDNYPRHYLGSFSPQLLLGYKHSIPRLLKKKAKHPDNNSRPLTQAEQ